MMDSPVGIAAWIVEKFHGWSDIRGDDIESAHSKDVLLTNIMVYIVTRTFNTASWIYYGRREEGGRVLSTDGAGASRCRPPARCFRPRCWSGRRARMSSGSTTCSAGPRCRAAGTLRRWSNRRRWLRISGLSRDSCGSAELGRIASRSACAGELIGQDLDNGAARVRATDASLTLRRPVIATPHAIGGPSR